MAGKQTQPKSGHLSEPSSNEFDRGSESSVPTELDSDEDEQTTTNYDVTQSGDGERTGGSAPVEGQNDRGYSVDPAPFDPSVETEGNSREIDEPDMPTNDPPNN